MSSPVSLSVRLVSQPALACTRVLTTASVYPASIPAKSGRKDRSQSTRSGQARPQTPPNTYADSVPLKVLLNAANVHDSMVFEELIGSLSLQRRRRADLTGSQKSSSRTRPILPSLPPLARPERFSPFQFGSEPGCVRFCPAPVAARFTVSCEDVGPVGTMGA